MCSRPNNIWSQHAELVISTYMLEDCHSRPALKAGRIIRIEVILRDVKVEG